MLQQISYLTLSFSLIIITFLITISHTKLVYLSQVYRHGARYPLYDYYDYNQTKQFRGILSSIGLRQHFLLGSYIQNDYIMKEKFINSILNYRQTEFFTMITDTERCEQSAYANKLGMFGFNNGAKIPSGIDTKLLDPPFQSIISENLRIQPQSSQNNFALLNGFQPTPIRYGMQYFPDCKNLNVILSRRSSTISKQLAQFQAQQAAFTDKMRLVFNMSLAQSNLKGLQDLADTLISDKFLGREMPEKFTEDDYRQIYFVRAYLLAQLYAGEVSQIINSPYLHILINNMQQKISNSQTYSKKLSTYSVHDLNIIPILTYFNLTSGDCLKKVFKNQTQTAQCVQPIPYAQNLVFQLHQDDKNSQIYYVKLRYNGVYYKLFGLLTVEVEFTQFKKKSLLNLKDFNKQCNGKVVSQMEQE